MAVLKAKEIKNMNKEQIKEKMTELKFELIKKNTAGNKSGKVKAKEIKKAIARLLTMEKHTQ